MKQGQPAPAKADECEHLKRVGDNYGVSCEDCGAALEGYGYGGFFGSNLTGHEQCLHVWVKAAAEQEDCAYCHRLRYAEQEIAQRPIRP